MSSRAAAAARVPRINQLSRAVWSLEPARHILPQPDADGTHPAANAGAMENSRARKEAQISGPHMVSAWGPVRLPRYTGPERPK
jgi:hypothetical protein